MANDESILEENIKLREEIARMKEESVRRRAYRWWVLNFLGDIVLGSRFKKSGRKLAKEVVDDRKVTSNTLGDFITYTLQRLTRVGIIMLIPVAFVGVQVYLLVVQNRLIKSQNAYIKEQTVLSEATRRSSAIIYLTDIFNQIDAEVRSDSSRNLSDQLIGRIIAVTSSLKPYQFLRNGNIISREISPERGQLLQILLNGNINLESIRKILKYGDFSRSDLRSVNWEGKYIPPVNLSNSDFSEANCRKTKFDQVVFNGSIMERGNYYWARFDSCSLTDVDFDGSILTGTWFTKCNLSTLSIEESTMNYAYFKDSYSEDYTWLLGLNSPDIEVKKYVSEGLSFYNEADGGFYRNIQRGYKINSIEK